MYVSVASVVLMATFMSTAMPTLTIEVQSTENIPLYISTPEKKLDIKRIL